VLKCVVGARPQLSAISVLSDQVGSHRQSLDIVGL
jgi:hypothetical protein